MPVLAVAAFARWQEAQACFEEHGFELAYFGRHGCIVDFLEGKVEQKIVQKTRKKQNVFDGKDHVRCTMDPFMYHGPWTMYHVGNLRASARSCEALAEVVGKTCVVTG